MYLSDRELVDRFGTRRPGRQLVAIETAALPVTLIGAQVLAQEEKGIPLVDEFVLRSASHGIDSASEMASFLGIEEGILEATLAGQLSAGNLIYDPRLQRIKLTHRGEVVAKELTSLRPTDVELSIVFDRLTWRIADYRESDLITRKQATEQGYIVIPPAQSVRISRSHVPPKEIEDLVARGKDTLRKYQVLDVESVRARKHRFLPIKLLIFSDGHSSAPELMAIVDGMESTAHENVLEDNGGASAIGISLASSADPAQSPDDVADEVHALLIDAGNTLDVEPDAHPLISQIGVFDHRDHLQAALSSASRRILILSPWIRRAVVDDAFVGDLERRLKDGVSVAIGHGYGPDDRGSDSNALKALESLRRRFPSLFSLVRLSSTHAKVLIYDDTYITTSFNWLSFRGDPTRTYRMEEGTLVRSRIYADKVFERYSRVLSGAVFPER